MIPVTKPDIRTKKEKMDEVNAILRMVAEKRGCKVSDLQWRKDKYGAIHVRTRKDGQKKEIDNQESQEDSQARKSSRQEVD